MNVSKLMRSLAAKTNPNDSAQWLPLWMHARDTAGIMKKLWKHWLPAAVRREICGGSEEALQENEALFQKVCVFLGMAHDIGNGRVSGAHSGNVAGGAGAACGRRAGNTERCGVEENL